MSKVIILNGPAGCGKDTVGQQFAEREGFGLTCFKEPMFRIAAATLGMDYHEFYECYQDREWKEAPNEKLNGQSVRELMIQISESFVKPFLGEDYFGQQAVSYIRLRPWQNRFVFTDGGFVPEMEALVAAGHEVILVHMYRDGCSFEGDSRSYVLTNSVPRIYTLTNNGTVDEAVDALGRILDSYEDLNRRDEPEQPEDDAPVARPRATRGMRGHHVRWTMPRVSTEDIERATEAREAERAVRDRSAVSDTLFGSYAGSTGGWITGGFEFNNSATNSNIILDELATVSESDSTTAVRNSSD